MTKFNLTQNTNQELKLFFFAVRPPNFVATVTEEGAAVIAYNLQDAFSKAAVGYTGRTVHLTNLGETNVKEILDQVWVGEVPKEAPREPPPAKETTKQQFILNLRLCADKYIVDQQKKDQLHELINNL